MIQVRKLKTSEQFLEHLASLGVSLPFVDEPPPEHADRYAILPMEGWDGTEEGRATDLVRRRWQRFGESGAGLIWGGEAVAVRADGRANPRQLLIGPDAAGLRDGLVAAHADRYGTESADALTIGLQLTHSGRYAVTGPLVAYEHPVLDAAGDGADPRAHRRGARRPRRVLRRRRGGGRRGRVRVRRRQGLPRLPRP